MFWFERLFDDAPQIERQARDERLDRETGKKKRDGAPPRYRCRVCALESEDGSYCPTCIAVTMEPFQL
jgi:hypothetical protein